MEITKAEIGFCVGITRVYRLMDKIAADQGSFHATHQCSSPHSNMEMDTLKRIERKDQPLFELYPNLEKVSVVDDVTQLRKGDKLVLGFHGLPNHIKDQVKEKGVTLLADLQCPFIARLNRVVEQLVAEGFDILIVGKKENHHCRDAQKTAGQYGRRCLVIEKPEDTESITYDEGRRWALVGQVTGNTLTFGEVVERLREKEIPVKIVRTVCSDSYLRQGIAINFAKDADVVVVVDDGGAASQSVFEVCSQLSKKVQRIRSKEDIKREWFEGVHKVAIVGGILVPQWSIDKVARHIKEICV